MTDSNWNNYLKQLPNNHILQTQEWGQVKSKYGWHSIQKSWSDQNNIFAAAQILTRTLTLKGIKLPFNVSYIPRGPVLDWKNTDYIKKVISDIETHAKMAGSIFIKIDPEIIIGRGIPGSSDDHIDSNAIDVVSLLHKRGWIFSKEQIQFRNTAVIDLNQSQDDLLANMKQKTRYNIRLSERKGVSVRLINKDDFPVMYKMYAETSLRDGFAIRSQEYYQDVWETFIFSNMCDGLIAEIENDPIAGLFIFYFNDRAWYLYGMSTNKHRGKMPNYLLQWEAIKRARFRGCKQYDLWGAPDLFDDTDPMWGVFRFKAGLGAKVIRTPGALDFPIKPNLYSLYMNVLPRILNIMRVRGNKKVGSLSGIN